MRLNNIPVWIRLTISFAILLLLLVIVACFGFWGTRNLSNQIIHELDSDGAISAHIAQASSHALGLRRYEKDIFLNIDNKEKISSYFEKWQSEYNKLTTNITALNKLTYIPEEQKATEKMLKGAQLYKQGFSGIYKDIQAGNITTPQAGNKAMSPLKGPIRELIENTALIHSASTKRINAIKSTIKRITRVSNIAISSALVLSLFFALVMIVIITRSITRPLHSVSEMLKKLGNGDLETRLNLTRKDELGEMARSLDTFADNMSNEVVTAFEKIARGDLTFVAHGVIKAPLETANRSLSEVLHQINLASEKIDAASNQVSGSSQSLSQGATETAAALEEISSSMNEMASQTSHMAENANTANQLAISANKDAENGGQQMQAMVQSMAEINEAGKSIGQIIKTVDEIAFQTNLLALNAAVEAARAGQHGKGFAVVAEEVRNLAARSAKAASETTELIAATVTKTENGSQIAEQTSATLTEIVASINKVTGLVSEIATASSEQAQGINQINLGLGQIDQGVQQNTAISEESAAAAEEMNSQAIYLRNMLSRFTLVNAPTRSTESTQTAYLT